MEDPATQNTRLDAVLRAVAALSLPGDEESRVEFARRLLSRAPESYLLGQPVAGLAADIGEMYRLVDETPPGQIGVRVRLAPGASHRAAIFTVMPDCSFIVETLREFFYGMSFGIEIFLHPVLTLTRGPEGHVSRVETRGTAEARTSVTFALVNGPIESVGVSELEGEIRRRLSLLRAATEDFPSMLERLDGVAAELEEARQNLEWRAKEVDEVRDLLAWLRDGNFVFLGYRSYSVDREAEGGPIVEVEAGSGLGILADETRSRVARPTPISQLPPPLAARLIGGPFLIVSKTNALSPIHRRARMDDLSIKRLGPDGEVHGLHRFLGLFTAKAFSQNASEIPVLRTKLAQILEAEEVEAGSHDYGLIVRTFNALPKEELFVTPVAELVATVDALLEAHASQDVLVFTRADDLGRGVNVMIVLPKRRFSAQIRQRIQEILVGAYGDGLLNYHLNMGEGEQARLHFYFAADPAIRAAVDEQRLTTAIREAVRSWDEKLVTALEPRVGRDEALRLRERYAEAFPPEYLAATRLPTIVRDVEILEEVRSTGRRRVTLVPVEPPVPDTYWLTAYAPGSPRALSDLMPPLENLGVRVLGAETYEIGIPKEPLPLALHAFKIQVRPEWRMNGSTEARLEAALNAIHAGWADDIRLNNLILSAGLEWREVGLMRAYGAYAFAIGAVASRLGLNRAVLEHPGVARLLFEIFCAQMDPALEGDREMAVVALADAFHEALEEVRSIEDDRTLRRLFALVRATVRTNYFQPAFQGDPEAPIALKFECGKIDFLPRPRPKFEVWVSSPRTEGAHLRMGAVARGGLRWSDRTEDFRREVLGLVKTQQVKNAVIVPAGAKGAFVVRRPPAGADVREAGVLSYRDFVGALLDITDNVRGGRVEHPPNTVIRDGEDPYLVVAADKGTATLSDTANELAAERGFWLGDAFASGGSRGYDHKKMGITARGAWECVRRHFGELGLNVDTDEFTVVGIGDMSGDVFGNGMLLSRKIRLIAAFDHRHIFLDPDPDPERSWQERRRLFELPSSSWRDYDPSRLSPGGGVYERGEKRIELSEAARSALGVEERVVNGNALIQAILRAPVDLLWNGGIGTYVKASDESHAEVGDPGNDTVRIDARELRARVVGEGGNLGLTQKARIEYALHGGRCNTDALDNSAGVDTSDHEVNLKILIGTAAEEEDTALSPEERQRLLARAEGDVCAAVLANCYWQSLAVSLDEHRVQGGSNRFVEALGTLEREGGLDRQLEFLPTSEQMRDRRVAGAPALTRPELAVLLAYAKLHLKQKLLEDDLARDPAFLELARGYFPPAVLARVGEQALARHRLRARIAATRLTNLMVDTMGGAGLVGLARESHRGIAAAAKAWFVAFAAGDAGGLRDRLRAAADVAPAGVIIHWFLPFADALDRATRWLLANAELGLDVESLVKGYGRPLARIREALPDLLPPVTSSALLDRVSVCRGDGLDEPLAMELATFEQLDSLLPAAALARETSRDAMEVGGVYFGIAAEIDFPWLQSQLRHLPAEDAWAQRAARALAIDLEATRSELTRKILAGDAQAQGGAQALLAAFRTSFAERLSRVTELIEELRRGEDLKLATLMVAVRAIAEECAAWKPLSTSSGSAPAPTG